MEELKSILIVDDEFGVRESLKMILKPIFQVHTAADGKEALRSIQKGKIDLVTLDLNMPGLSGIEVLRQIKENNPEIEVIIITAYSNAENKLEANRYGAGGIICKPFNIPEVIDNLNKSLKRQTYNMTLKNYSLYNSLVVRN
jgi:DNA-binding NtrC family response regulator